MMLFPTEAAAVRSAESMAEAARDARAETSYRVFEVGGEKPYRVTDASVNMGRARLVAWVCSDGQKVKRLKVGR